jgi:hypothetical protein
MAGYETKDSGDRLAFKSGMERDTNIGKACFDLLVPKGVPYKDQMLTRFAELMARGATKYSSRNWEKASGQEELDRFKESAFRHFMQWMTNEADEDHASAVYFNILGYETVKSKLKEQDERKKDKAIKKVVRESYARGHARGSEEAAMEAY